MGDWFSMKSNLATNSPWIAGLLIIFFTVLVFSPSLGGGFLNWDDNLILENYGWRGLAGQNLHWWFTRVIGGDYKPLVWASFAIDYTFWSLNPAGYHLGNLLLHAATAFLLYLLFLKTTAPPRVDCALFAALIFALHPLRVESVAWITARKDVLSAFFYLLAILFYLRRFKSSGTKRMAVGINYSLSILCAFLAALSKATAATIPMVLILIDFFALRRFGKHSGRVLLEKVPYLIMALAVTAGALAGQGKNGVLLSLGDVGIVERLYLAGQSCFFYLIKTVDPGGLQPIYPRVPISLLSAGMKFFPLAGILVLTGFFLYLRRKRCSWPLFCWLVYLVMLLPVSGLFLTGKSFLADRFSYLPAMAISLALYYGFIRLPRKAGTILRILCWVIVLGLSILTIKQELVWRNSVSLWKYTLNRFPRCATALDNLGNALYKRGEYARAAACHTRAISLKPDDPNIHYNLALALVAEGEIEESIPCYRQAILLQPRHVKALNNLGGALVLMGKLDQAIKYYREVIRIDPDHAGAHYNLGVVRYRLEDYKEAIDHLTRALKLNPDFFAARDYLEKAKEKAGMIH